MKKKCLLTSCLFLIVLVFTLPHSWGFRNLKEGEKVPDFNLKDLDGKTHSLSQSKRKVSIILYWRPYWIALLQNKEQRMPRK